MKNRTELKTKVINALLFTGLLIISIVGVSLNSYNQAHADEALIDITVYKTPTCGCCRK